MCHIILIIQVINMKETQTTNLRDIGHILASTIALELRDAHDRFLKALEFFI